MEDPQVLDRIEELVAEEHRLLELEERQPLDADARARRERIAIQLDQCWDLLRRRRGLREFGHNPDTAAVRSEDMVERFEQ